MRVLVTRPAPDAERTARALRDLGCEPVLAPVSLVEAVDTPAPEGPFAGVLLSSQNAVRHGVARLARALLSVPVFAVGGRTAEAARQAGWANVRPGPGDAKGLAEIVAGTLPTGARLLYLTGTPRKPDLEAELGVRGYRVESVEVYRTLPAARLPDAVRDCLAAGSIDAVLHYSREGAQRMLRLAEAAGLASEARGLWHLCLSREVAGACDGCTRVLIANQPNEEFLLKLLDDCPLRQ